ncbi:NAD(P)H-binding protein [Nigerium massiliense]|uniref:NAD(P)H-binding protein n=1 Tax=Nigerium massiliense TaxID=1522317 RepID=UPI001F45E8E0|nr:NAD(P)H-binding protein [Nigerium massiliense]
MTPIAVDASDRGQVASLVAGADAVVVALRFPEGQERRVSDVTARCLDAAQAHHASVLIVGGSAPLTSPTTDALVLDDPRWVPAEWRDIAAASLAQWEACRAHAYQRWTYLSPSAVFEPGQPTGRYRRGTTTLLVDGAGNSRVTPGELALALLDELESPSGEQHFTVAS